MTITKEGIEALRKERPTPNADVKHTINGPVQTAVHSTVEADRIGRLNQLDRTMQKASDDLENNMAFKAKEGYLKSQFEPKPVTPKHHHRTSPQLREPSGPQPPPSRPPKPMAQEGPQKTQPIHEMEQ